MHIVNRGEICADDGEHTKQGQECKLLLETVLVSF